MRGDLISLDLETTGFDPARDEIIEVAAVRFRDGVISDSFQTLVNPARTIPNAVVQLTGIRDEDVIGAPAFEQVLPLLLAFAGDAPIVGHNVGFDLGFLNQRGALRHNLPVDTYELALVLLPSAARYNLTALITSFGVDIGTAHRALYDARATALLYWFLFEKALTLPAAVLSEIVNSSSGLNWSGAPTFEAALREAPPSGPMPEPRAFAISTRAYTKRREPDVSHPLDPDRVAAVFNPSGALARTLPSYETRPQQVEMAVRVTDALNHDEHLMIEAGTGIGKSLAYLLPAALWAMENNTRVVVSTNTLNLQDQLLADDIPTLVNALDLPLEAAALKGRGNYLCPRQWAFARTQPPATLDELRMRAKLLVWLQTTETGEKGELSLRGGAEHAIWHRWSADHPSCNLETCRTAAQGRCPFYKAHLAAESAHIVVVNHALLFSDAMSDFQVLSPYEHVIIDEAHHLEEALTSALTYRLEREGVERSLVQLGDAAGRGLLPDLIAALQATGSAREVEKLSAYIQDLYPVIHLTQRHNESFFHALNALSNRRGESNTRVTRETRGDVAFAAIQDTGDRLVEFLAAVADALAKVAGALRRSKTFDLVRYEPLLDQTGQAATDLAEMGQRVNLFARPSDENTIYWLNTYQERPTPSINAAPLHVGAAVDRTLWSAKKSVIMTSATLRTQGSFDYLQARLRAETVETVELGSPFDYRKSTLLYLPTDMPDPSDKGRYQREVERGIIELAAALGGRTMALFTSYSQLKQTSAAITARLALGNIVVLEQADSVNRRALLETFKASPRAVLLATRSFWEGVDIPGDTLSALILVRLPFAVPSDPIVAARSDTFSDAFNDYSIPDAILRFRQGFGRLIRSANDRGIVSVFDNRIINKGYGAAFIDSLPDCTIEQGSLSNLPTQAVRWLAQPKP